MDEGDSTQAVVALPWIERGEREFKDIAATSTIVVLLALAVVSLYRALTGSEGDQLPGAIAGFVLAAVGGFVWYGPLGKLTGSVVSVDRDGMWIRHRGWRLWPGNGRIELSRPKHLPAIQIGHVELVGGERRAELWRRSMALRYEGRLVGWTRNTVDRDTVRAVLIEQVGADLARPWWLVRCHQPEQLVQALELARRSS